MHCSKASGDERVLTAPLLGADPLEWYTQVLHSKAQLRGEHATDAASTPLRNDALPNATRQRCAMQQPPRSIVRLP
eukprot:1682072-Alexandrium_andersonii.AAC.1